MLNLPGWMIAVLTEFAPVIYGVSTWCKVEVLVTGAILTTGKRTVSAVLRTMGLSDDRNYAKYQHVLSRAAWSGLDASRVMLGLLLKHFDTGGPLVFGIDETIERRRGEKIRAKGIYRDPVRSSKSHFVKASGLRWVSMMWLTRVPFAERIWALPVLTALAASERYYEEQGRTPKKITDWARQLVCQLRRWLPNKALIIVGDSTYAALDFLHACQSLRQPVTVITRLRLDAALYESAPPYSGKGRPRKKGARLPTPQQLIADPTTRWTRLPFVWYNHQLRDIELSTHQAIWYHSGQPAVPIRFILIRDVLGKFDPQTLLSTDLTLDPLDLLVFFKRRWQMEPTFQQVRTHLGVETQRQWSDKAILRTTPLLLGLFSLVTLLANDLFTRHHLTVRTAAWDPKQLPTFSDALALVRRRLWPSLTFQLSADDPDMVKVPRALLERFNDLLSYAA
ncbi:MAG: IS701 family transposase [Aggregatilineales bacterium]